MNDIVLNGETLEISRVVDSIEIEGFDHAFVDGKMETKVVIGGGTEPILEEKTITEMASTMLLMTNVMVILK